MKFIGEKFWTQKRRNATQLEGGNEIKTKKLQKRTEGGDQGMVKDHKEKE